MWNFVSSLTCVLSTSSHPSSTPGSSSSCPLPAPPSLLTANTYVFPGGRLDASDYSPRWRQLYQQCTAPTHDPYHPILSLRNPNSPRLPIYREVPEGPIVGEVAFRICAIREMFEEAGVLLVRDRDQVAQIVDCLPGTFPSAVKAIPASTRSRWRKEVHNSGEEFLNLCS